MYRRDTQVGEGALLLRVEVEKSAREFESLSFHSQIAIVESPQCLAVRAIERFPIVILGRMRPGRIDIRCMSLLTTVTSCQHYVDPAKGLTFWTQRDIASAQKRIIGRVRVCTFAGIAQLVEHSTCNREVAGSIPAFSITSLLVM